MAILQILGQKPSPYDEQFASCNILRQFYPTEEILGVASSPKDATRQKQFFGKF